MTAAPNSLLVCRVQKALELADAEFQSNPALPCRSRHLAQAALAACEPEALTSTVRRLIAVYHSEKHKFDTHLNEGLVEEARVLLARLEAKP